MAENQEETIAEMLAREAEDAERVREAMERGEIPYPPMYRNRGRALPEGEDG